MWLLTSEETIRLLDGEKGGRGYGGRGRGELKMKIPYLSLHCHHQNDSCIKVGTAMGALLMFH